jgi:hydroxypyruvate reductase
LAQLAPNADQLTLIISDTNSGDETSVASGPTLAPAPQDQTALQVVQRYRLATSLPNSVLTAIEEHAQPEYKHSGAPAHFVILSNQTVLAAAAAQARQLGFGVRVVEHINEQPIVKGCDLLLSELNKLSNDASGRTVCLISGGEFSCPVQGQGVGGRNSETVLRCAIELGKGPETGARHRLILSAGTDGIDGNSPAAGAIANEDTTERAEKLGLDPYSFLANSDSFTFFEELNDTIITGPSGTNVRDLRIALAT